MVPAAEVVTSPCEPAALLMVATFSALLRQVTLVDTSWVVPSVNVPVAVYCSVWPNAMLLLAGVTLIDTNVAALTVNVVFEVIVPRVAVMVDVPTLLDVATPRSVAALLMVATFTSLLVHST